MCTRKRAAYILLYYKTIQILILAKFFNLILILYVSRHLDGLPRIIKQDVQ